MRDALHHRVVAGVQPGAVGGDQSLRQDSRFSPEIPFSSGSSRHHAVYIASVIAGLLVIALADQAAPALVLANHPGPLFHFSSGAGVDGGLS